MHECKLKITLAHALLLSGIRRPDNFGPFGTQTHSSFRNNSVLKTRSFSPKWIRTCSPLGPSPAIIWRHESSNGPSSSIALVIEDQIL
jgi:hypothetical protein